MQILYQVIIENQKIRNDLLKWKLILSAALASIGFGATSATSVHALPHIDLVLCCIPFVAAYVDPMCSHVSLRVQVIGKFVRLAHSAVSADSSLHTYEQFVEVTRDKQQGGKLLNAFTLETWAMYASSFVLDGLIVAYGVFVALKGVQHGQNAFTHALSFWLSGAVGAALIVGIERSYRLRYKAINSVPKDILQQLAKEENAQA